MKPNDRIQDNGLVGVEDRIRNVCSILSLRA